MHAVLHTHWVQTDVLKHWQYMDVTITPVNSIHRALYTIYMSIIRNSTVLTILLKDVHLRLLRNPVVICLACAELDVVCPLDKSKFYFIRIMSKSESNAQIISNYHRHSLFYHGSYFASCHRSLHHPVISSSF